jgi:hypothetical protein
MKESIIVPESWSDINVMTWIELLSVAGDDDESNLERISILLDEDPDMLRKLPIEVISQIMDSLKFVYDSVEKNKADTYVCENRTYKKVTVYEEMSLSAWIDIESVMAGQKKNEEYHKLLACLWNPVYSGEYTRTDQVFKDMLAMPVDLATTTTADFFEFANKLPDGIQICSLNQLKKTTWMRQKTKELKGKKKKQKNYRVK